MTLSAEFKIPLLSAAFSSNSYQQTMFKSHLNLLFHNKTLGGCCLSHSYCPFFHFFFKFLCSFSSSRRLELETNARAVLSSPAYRGKSQSPQLWCASFLVFTQSQYLLALWAPLAFGDLSFPWSSSTAPHTFQVGVPNERAVFQTYLMAEYEATWQILVGSLFLSIWDSRE